MSFTESNLPNFTSKTKPNEILRQVIEQWRQFTYTSYSNNSYFRFNFPTVKIVKKPPDVAHS